MSARLQMYTIFLVLGILMGCVLWRMNRALPVFSKTPEQVDNTIIGDSATDNANDGPAYMGANWAWPMPLAFWNPVSTVSN